VADTRGGLLLREPGIAHERDRTRAEIMRLEPIEHRITVIVDERVVALLAKPPLERRVVLVIEEVGAPARAPIVQQAPRRSAVT
jgi:hypothetical protein